MKYASEEKAQIEKALWEMVKTASMALMKLNEIESQPMQESEPMKINPMAERLASLRMKSETQAPILANQKMPEVQPIRKASLTDDKIKSFATRIGNEVLPKVSSDEYDLRILFKQSNTWNDIKDKIDSNSVKAIVGGVNDMIQNKLDEQELKIREQEVKKQALLKQKQALLKQAEEQKKIELLESRKQKVANTIKAQKIAIMDSIIKEMKPFVKQGNLNSINVALQKSSTWQSVKANLSSQQERNAFFSDMIHQAGFLEKTSDFQRDVMPPNRDSFSTGVQTNKQTEKVKPSSSLPDGEIDNIGLSAPDAPLNRARNIDHGEAYGKMPSSALDITETVQSGGSAKVIPDNKGFANNSSPLRQAGDEELENLWSTDEDEHEYDNEDAGGEYAGGDEIEEELDDDDFFNE